MLASTFDLISSFSATDFLMVGANLAPLLIAVFILAQNVKKRSSRFLLFLMAALFVWNFVAALFLAGADRQIHTQGTLLGIYAAAAIVPIATYLFFSVFTDEGAFLSYKQLIPLLAPYALIVLFLKTPGFVVGYEPPVLELPGRIVFSYGYIIYIVYVLAFLALSMNMLIKKYQQSAGIFKDQVRDLLIVFSFGIIFALAFAAFSPLREGSYDFFWMGALCLAFAAFLLELVIIKYNFWSFKIIAVELLITLVLSILLVEFFFAASFTELIFKVAITALVVFSSFFLVKSVEQEIRSKERIQNLLRDLDDTNARLQVLDKKKSEFLSIASHHLRDPLTAISGYASMLLEGSFGELSSQVRNALKKIFESSKRLITMISDFMDISNIETGNMQYKFSDVDIRKLVTEVVDDMRQNADHAHIALTLAIDGSEDEQYITVADHVKMRQVISNIVDNSIKYTPSGGVAVALAKSKDKRKIVFSVSDTGIGMSEETKDKIFKKFSRAEGINKVYTEGAGLGLYVVSEIVKKHEGRVWAESQGEGHGSQFYVELEAKG